MSSILKALEKVEEAQNARRSAGGGFVKARERRSPWVLPVAVLSGAVVAALATFAAMGGFSRHKTQAPATEMVKVEPAAKTGSAAKPLAPAAPLATIVVSDPAVKADPPPQAAPQQPRKQADRAKPAQKTADTGGKESKAPRAAASTEKRSAKTAVAKPAQKSAKAKAEEKRAAKRLALMQRNAARAAERQAASAPAQAVAARASAPAVAPAPAVAAAPALEKSRPSVSVTGIAWQNEGASSMAMVNGKAVRQGATVDGYKVEQIFEDKVRFSGANGKLDVPLSAGE